MCGKTGVGKSTLVKTLIVDLARKGHGVGVIDPHGDLADDVLEAIGRERRVVLFDPSREDCPGLNPLAHDGTDEGVERAMEELTRTMFSLYPADMMGPMFDRHSRSLLLPLLCAEESLADVAKMATDAAFRTRTLRRLNANNPLHADVRRFWEEEFSRWSETHKGEMITYTVSKYDALVKSSALRRVCDTQRPQLDVTGVLAEGGVLVARLPEATLGPVSAWFLGMMLLSRLRKAAFARGKLQKRDRRPFVLALDEFQKFVGGGGFGYKDDTRTLGPMLDECRKFGVSLVLANQYVAQLDAATRNAVFGNVGSIVCFRTGAADAELIATEFGAGTSDAELRALPLYHGLARLLVNGQATPVFTVRTLGGDGR
ncbi:hypothetical protein LBMAG42_57160 [Deltaproteobacteria bacterium]|nr:hypothetical protein LBMAG42_57160 [Deltaproteobacteria bacterium]